MIKPRTGVRPIYSCKNCSGHNKIHEDILTLLLAKTKSATFKNSWIAQWLELVARMRKPLYC